MVMKTNTSGKVRIVKVDRPTLLLKYWEARLLAPENAIDTGSSTMYKKWSPQTIRGIVSLSDGVIITKHISDTKGKIEMISYADMLKAISKAGSVEYQLDWNSTTSLFEFCGISRGQDGRLYENKNKRRFKAIEEFGYIGTTSKNEQKGECQKRWQAIDLAYCESLVRTCNELKKQGKPSLYGMNRLFSTWAVTHIWGTDIIRTNVGSVVEQYKSATTLTHLSDIIQKKRANGGLLADNDHMNRTEDCFKKCVFHVSEQGGVRVEPLFTDTWGKFDKISVNGVGSDTVVLTPKFYMEDELPSDANPDGGALYRHFIDVGCKWQKIKNAERDAHLEYEYQVKILATLVNGTYPGSLMHTLGETVTAITGIKCAIASMAMFEKFEQPKEFDYNNSLLGMRTYSKYYRKWDYGNVMKTLRNGSYYTRVYSKFIERVKNFDKDGLTLEVVPHIREIAKWSPEKVRDVCKSSKFAAYLTKIYEGYMARKGPAAQFSMYVEAMQHGMKPKPKEEEPIEKFLFPLFRILLGDFDFMSAIVDTKNTKCILFENQARGLVASDGGSDTLVMSREAFSEKAGFNKVVDDSEICAFLYTNDMSALGIRRFNNVPAFRVGYKIDYYRTVFHPNSDYVDFLVENPQGVGEQYNDGELFYVFLMYMEAVQDVIFELHFVYQTILNAFYMQVKNATGYDVELISAVRGWNNYLSRSKPYELLFDTTVLKAYIGDEWCNKLLKVYESHLKNGMYFTKKPDGTIENGYPMFRSISDYPVSSPYISPGYNRLRKEWILNDTAIHFTRYTNHINYGLFGGKYSRCSERLSLAWHCIGD